MANEMDKRPLDQELDRATLFSLVTGGDTSALTVDQKLKLYAIMCDRVGIDRALTPFVFIKTKGGERLYAAKSCANQLAVKHKVSCKLAKEEIVSGILLVYFQASTPDTRFTDEIGAVTIEGLKGDDLANARMKCFTKSKRRAVLSHCGLGVLDESEAETMGGVQATFTPELPAQPALPAPQPPPPAAEPAAGAPTAEPARKPPVRKKQPEVAAAAPTPSSLPQAAPTVPAPVPPPAAPAPQPTAAGAPIGLKVGGLGDRMSKVCAAAGTSWQNGLKFLNSVLGVSDIAQAGPMKIHAVMRALELVVAQQEKRAAQVLINQEPAAWMTDEQRRALDSKFLELVNLKHQEIQQEVQAKKA